MCFRLIIQKFECVKEFISTVIYESGKERNAMEIMSSYYSKNEEKKRKKVLKSFANDFRETKKK